MRSPLDFARNPQPYQIPLYYPPYPSVINQQPKQSGVQQAVANVLRGYNDVNLAELKRLRGDLTAYRQEENSGFRTNVAFPRATVDVGSFDGAGITDETNSPVLARLEPLPAPEKITRKLVGIKPPTANIPALRLDETGGAAEEEDDVGSLSGEYDDESVGSVSSGEVVESVAPPSTTDNVASLMTTTTGVDVGGAVTGVPRGRINQGLATASALGSRMRIELEEQGEVRPIKDPRGEPLTRKMISDASGLTGKGKRTPAMRSLAVKYGIDLAK